jgi:hypothetical protein
MRNSVGIRKLKSYYTTLAAPSLSVLKAISTTANFSKVSQDASQLHVRYVQYNWR